MKIKKKNSFSALRSCSPTESGIIDIAIFAQYAGTGWRHSIAKRNVTTFKAVIRCTCCTGWHSLYLPGTVIFLFDKNQ